MTRPRLLQRGQRTADRDAGQVTAFVVVWVMALLLVIGLVLDGGLALAGKIRAIDEAQEAARAGAQQLDLTAYRNDATVTLDPAAATAAARSYLATTGVIGASVNVAGNRVTVRVTRQQPTQLLQLLGIRGIDVHGSGAAVAAHGIEEPIP